LPLKGQRPPAQSKKNRLRQTSDGGQKDDILKKGDTMIVSNPTILVKPPNLKKARAIAAALHAAGFAVYHRPPFGKLIAKRKIAKRAA
jgi:hypothetical protein